MFFSYTVKNITYDNKRWNEHIILYDQRSTKIYALKSSLYRELVIILKKKKKL